jgi:threonyl-tRNA synthetase
MNKINIKFPDGNNKEVESGLSAKEIIEQEIGEGLLRAAIAVELDDNKIIDLNTPITTTTTFKVLTFKDKKGKEIYWHSSSHILALAVKRLFKNTKFGIGPAIEEGFYYDFDIGRSFSEEDLENIEKEAIKILKEKIPFKRLEVDYNKAKEILKDQPYKLELLQELKEKGEVISLYKLDDWYDLCRGPHVEHTGKIKAFKILKNSGAYWRGDSNNAQLQRIYAISFSNKKNLKEFIYIQEEAKKRDHRIIGKQLDLFSFHKQAPGMPFFHHKGSIMWDQILDFVKSKMLERDYEINKTPIVLNQELWLQSGHWNHYKENMYFTKIDKQDFAIRPMNCPGNILVYKSHQYSYRDLPIRAGEFGLVHRHELSGVLSGLFRVRCFTQDDAHIFCTKEQMKDEIKDLIDFVDEVYTTFGFDYNIELSTKPDKAMGDPKLWDLAENTLKEVLDESNKEYKINAGGGAFYGPKIDFHLIDAIGRSWQCGTIQLDFQMPEKFDLTYEGKDNTKKRPVMIHRAIIGSVERFLGNLIEHYAGKFPLWIAPTQVILLPIADRHIDYCKNIKEKLKKEGIRVEINSKAETMNKKIRNAELQKINYIAVIGDQELNNNTLNIRTRDNKILGEKDLTTFINDLNKEITEKRINRE